MLEPNRDLDLGLGLDLDAGRLDLELPDRDCPGRLDECDEKYRDLPVG